MTVKTIAEIMGWTVHNPHRCPGGDPGGDVLGWKCSECGEWINDGAPLTECASAWNQHPKPTPDDMLVWLRERGRAVRAFLNVDSVSVHVDRLEGPWLFYVQPTFHAALEAAVRAVHDAEEAL